jgi:hypothetical protein
MAKNQRWKMGAPNSILDKAAEMVRESETGVTLRQLFYMLVSEGIIENTRGNYTALSSTSAIARRDGIFPELIDQTRDIYQLNGFDGVGDALSALTAQYTRDRTEGQDVAVYIGVEKHAMRPQLAAWFRGFGVPIINFGGFASQTYVDDIKRHVEAEGRPSVLLYAGDLDPSGVEIYEDFMRRSACFDENIKIAVHPEQTTQYGLVRSYYEKEDTRNESFKEKYGALYQVEVEAIAPATLRGLYEKELFKFFDLSRYEAAVELEGRERDELRAIAARHTGGGE